MAIRESEKSIYAIGISFILFLLVSILSIHNLQAQDVIADFEMDKPVGCTAP